MEMEGERSSMEGDNGPGDGGEVRKGTEDNTQGLEEIENISLD